MAGALDTSKVANRRKPRFNSIDDLRAEIERIVAADEAGQLRLAGNWTAGQVLGHLAAWINYAYDGFPVKQAPWFIRVYLRMKLKSYLRDKMPAGVKIPGVEGGTTGIELLTTADAAAKLRRALDRLASNEPAPHNSPAFGKLDHEQSIALNLRHAELHLSFLTY